MKMTKRSYAFLTALIVALSGCGVPAASDTLSSSSAPMSQASQPSQPTVEYPTKPVQVVVAASAGGGTDLQIRAIAPFFSKYFGQEMVPMAVPGGSGTIGMTQLANAAPDGYTIGVPYTGGVSIMPSYGDTAYTSESFQYICEYSNSPIVLVVNGKGDVKTLEDLIAKGKAGNVLYSCAPNGAMDLAIQAFAMKAGITMTNVPAEGAAPSITNVLGNQVQAAGLAPMNLKGYIESGDLLPLVIFEAERLKSLPDVPTAKEKGVDMVASVWNGFAVPKDTPDEIVEILRKGFAEILADPECIKAIEALNATMDYFPHDKLEETIENEKAMYGELIKAQGAK